MAQLVVFDLDGTLAMTHHRDHFIQKPRKDWRAFFAACVDDAPNEAAIAVFKALKSQGYRVEIWSGRSDEVRVQTEAWLAAHGIEPDLLQMRKQGDMTPDYILKEGWLRAAGQTPLVIFDDRDKVVAMWRHHGVTCFQVASGDF